MISGIFHALIYQPLYNTLVFFVNLIPTHDIGIAVILVTIIVRLILYPLSRRAIAAQMAMKKVAPDIEAIKEKYKDKPEEQGKAIFQLYRERDVHPFAGFLLLLIQLPVLIGLYWVFARGGFPKVDPQLLYSFVHVPSAVNMEFLGFVNMAHTHNIVLAILVALSQFAYTRLSMGARVPGQGGSATPVGTVEASFSGEMAKSFDLQARYFLPLMIGVVSYLVVAAAPLYWVTSNIFMIAQELFSGRRFDGRA
jgi:YidC/Oxa1 family membrane protein insertase